MKIKKLLLEILTQMEWSPQTYYSQQLDAVAEGLPRSRTATSAADALYKQTENTVIASPLFMSLILLNLHWIFITIDTSVSRLALAFYT